MLPVAKPLSHVAKDSVFEITVRRYGNGALPFTLYEDDGETFNYRKGEQNTLLLSGGKALRKGGYTGAPRYIVGEWIDV